MIMFEAFDIVTRAHCVLIDRPKLSFYYFDNMAVNFLKSCRDEGGFLLSGCFF